MPMLADPSQKYPPRKRFPFPERTWPDKDVTRAPLWMSSDMRDGNQAQPTVMSPQAKMDMFNMLVHQIGFKQVEVSFPASSQDEFDFTRKLIDENLIPDDTQIIVLTQAKPEMIQRTFDAIKGAKNPILHFYIGTSESFRKRILNKTEAEVTDLAVASTRQIKKLAEQHPEMGMQLEFSLEHASDTDVHAAKRLIDEISEAWGATPENPVIINYPATVEYDKPNIYADQIEWISRNIKNRDSIILSVHPHNDRGTGVAAAELAMQAGADRVEGTLFGNGERTGNVDIMTLAMNLYKGGVSPELNFSDLPGIVATWERCTGLTVPARHPYAGELAFTAFSGSHQDAIKKGMALPTVPWQVPYIPVDPADIGRTYEGIIRVNAQSGRAAGAVIMREQKGLELPPALIKHFADVIQAEADRTGAEVSPETVVALFKREYKSGGGGLHYIGHEVCGPLENTDKDTYLFNLTTPSGNTIEVTGQGNGPVSALTNAFGVRTKTTPSFTRKTLDNGPARRRNPQPMFR